MLRLSIGADGKAPNQGPDEQAVAVPSQSRQTKVRFERRVDAPSGPFHFWRVRSAIPDRKGCRRMAQAKKNSAQVAPALKAARLKAKSKAKPDRPPSGRPPRSESDVPSATLIAGSPRRARAPPRRHHLDRRAAEIAAQCGDDDELLDTRQLANLLHVSTAWVEIARHEGNGPPFVRLTPRCVRYRRGEVRRWLIERSHRWTGEYAR
jgi:predicted DNA-binding transcriptional regulator AlpA